MCDYCNNMYYVKCGWTPEFESFTTEEDRDL